MERLIRILCFACLFFLVCPSELQHDLSNDILIQDHDVKNWVGKSFSHFQNARGFESQPVQLQFRPVYKNLASAPLGSLFGNSTNSTQCYRDLIYMAENLIGSSDQWAMKMVDSYGKLGSGILEGRLKWVGEYTECTRVYAPPNLDATAGNFHGRYCSLEWSAKVANSAFSVTSGVCLPDTCSASEIHGDIQKLLMPVVDVLIPSGTEPILNVTNLTCKTTHRHLNASAKVVIALLSLFCALVVLGSSITAVKHFLEEEETDSGKSTLVTAIPPNDITDKMEESADSEGKFHVERNTSLGGKFHGYWKECEPFLDCFCIFHNGTKILNTRVGEGELVCLHGIRFLSMTWVILGHTYSTEFAMASKPLEIVEMASSAALQIIIQGYFAVDAFFVLSGFLLTYLSMREMAKNKGGISWPSFYIHRYFRLTPVYMIVLAFSATVYFYLGSGPTWPDKALDTVCRDNWWRNLLYINNFAHVTNQCMAWSWYLANDMQFFVISPLFLITLWRWPRIGCSLVALFLCACWLANFAITYHFDLIAGVGNLLGHPADYVMKGKEKFTGKYYTDLYIMPYARIDPYLIGMLAGYVLFAKKRSDKPKHSWAFLGMCWTVASAVTLVCIYGIYHTDPSLTARSFYNAFSRTSFAVGLSWVIYVCLVEQGGFVNRLLSFPMFIPLSRLTYSAYLIHPMVITTYLLSLKATLEFSHATGVMVYLGIIVITYGISLLVTLVLESPIIGLEKLIRRSLTPKRDT